MEVDTLSIILLCLIVFFTFLSIREAPNSDVHPLLLTSQSDAAKVRYPGETAVYRSNNSQHGMPLLTTPENGVKTIAQMFQHGLEEGKDCLGSRDINGAYTWQTYRQIFERITNFGSGLIKRTGLTSKSQDKFGIFMKNCPEWVIADLAACHYSLISVALPSIRPRVNDVINQINLTEISIIVVSKDTLQIAFSAAPSCKTLKYIIITESSLTKDQNEKAENLGLTLTTFNDIEKLGSTSKLECVPAEPEDTATIVFTSGTTSGGPKGVELKHSNILANVAGILATIHITQKIKTSDRHLSYLPLAYVFERITVMTLLFSGASIAFYSGKISTVLKDAEEVKPTIFTSTPRILSLFHENILKSLENKWFFKRGFNSKLKSLKKGSLVTNSIWDILVFNQVKAKFGGQVRVIVTASDPIPQTLLDFFRITVGCQVLQSYGLTQCSGAVTINAFYDYYSIDQNGNDSHTGGPLACNEIKLINYEERGYTVEDVPNPRGEICVRGPNVMKGYYNLPDETSRIIDADGWFHTGDIGMILPNGTLKIIDRK
ncbi:long-chain-fatty-acid--CoA ligase 5 [Gigaspora margarita]|uniref:Long-chain-fatty-acid--CoA ligase 5 n=1 Tax=Gigaspora margarita TaxID=4874 RepID=A0A8H4ACY5_GIGMA|nr:long-chain-fatty-acid--CoA ligase 5 [Gigaspora margarita]